jgi:hypothetical protein
MEFIDHNTPKYAIRNFANDTHNVLVLLIAKA